MTTNNNTLQRRSFLKVSALAGGGVLIGVSTLSSCQTEEARDLILLPELEQPEAWAEVNHYIKIGDNGVITLLSPNPEIGQNVKTSMPMIVAEELEADWDMVQVEQTGLNTEWYQRQVAGGSQSIRAEWDALRKAGATAKTMMVTAAAAEWGVEPSTCKVSKGVVTSPTGETLDYGSLASRLVDMEVPEDVPLKDANDYTIIGQDTRNVDIKPLVTGQPLFGIDTRVEGMKYASVLRPPAFGQRLDNLDDSDAVAVNGVEKVIQFGDKIAVVANSNWAAIKGKKALKAEWSTDTKLESTADHDKLMLAMLDETPDNTPREDGDVEKAFAEADEVVERVYESPFLPHSCLEPMNFFAHVTEEKIYCKGPIQTPAWTENRIAGLTGRPNEEIEIDMTRMGGGFGRRLYGDFALEAVEISDLVGAPIQLLFTREDDMTAGTYRVALKYKIRASLKDG
ncbi:MAG: molybdopterin cofactor-binding domain-containing protein [Bacteroidota bacterium]